MKSFISLSDIDAEALADLVDRGQEIIAGKWDTYKPLQGKKVGIYFRRSSTRTRTAFTVGVINLGGSPVVYAPGDLQLSTGETIEDTGRVLSEYLDGFVMRTNDPVAEMRAIAAAGTMPIINAMSDSEHPTQAVGDLITIKEKFGRLDGIHVLYVGEGNNTASALALATAKMPGMKITLVTPRGYGLDETLVAEAQREASKRGASVAQHHRVDDLPSAVDVVYATRWETMGVSHADPNWRNHFKPLCVTEELMARVSKPEGTIFMHDLPAVRGGDVVDAVLDGPQSVAFRQARHKLTGAMVVLDYCTRA